MALKIARFVLVSCQITVFFFPLRLPLKKEAQAQAKTGDADVFEAPPLTASRASINIETSLSSLYIYISLELENGFEVG